MQTLLTSLQNIGFTSYEARVFVALVQNKSATVATLNSDSGVPNSAIYGALKKLEKRGIIELQNSKPMRYKCLPPDIAIFKLKHDFDLECERIQSQLDGIYNTSFEETSDEGVWTIKGVNNVANKILQLVEESTKEILILSSSTPFAAFAERGDIHKKDYLKIMQLFNKKIAQGVNVKLISSSESEAIKMNDMVPLAQIKVNDLKNQLNGLKSFIMLVDNSKTLLSMVNKDDGNLDLSAIWANGEDFSNTMSHLLNARWEISKTHEIGV
jgi:sugar-specific transcriptional regulator TrmB